jgi:methionine sulfoxide reductase heme-binding subunit
LTAAINPHTKGSKAGAAKAVRTRNTIDSPLGWLRPATHTAALLPLAILVFDYLTNNLTFNPIQAAVQRTGRIALSMLVITLACTPIYILFKLRPVTALRRTFGLYAFFYASVHFLLYTGLDYGFNSNLVLDSFRNNFFIWYGAGTFLILLPMAVTSHRWWMTRLGKNWARLHRLIYLAAVLAVVHYAYALKGNILLLRGNIAMPLLYGAATLLLLTIRVPWVRTRIEMIRRKLTAIRTGSR